LKTDNDAPNTQLHSQARREARRNVAAAKH